MDWPRPGAVLHTTGLWGGSYLDIGSRAASRAWQNSLLKGRHRLTMRETLPWKYTHMGSPEGNQAIRTTSPVQGLTWASKHQCWAWRQTAPPSLTDGGAGGTPPGFAIRGIELVEEKGARIPGWRGMAQQTWHRPALPARYLLPNTGEETGSMRRQRILVIKHLTIAIDLHSIEKT